MKLTLSSSLAFVLLSVPLAAFAQGGNSFAGPSAEQDPWYSPRHTAADAQGDVKFTTTTQSSMSELHQSSVDISAIDFYVDTHPGRQGEGKSVSGKYAHFTVGLSGESLGDNHDLGIKLGWKNKQNQPQSLELIEKTRTNPEASWQRLSTRVIKTNGKVAEKTTPNQLYTNCGWDLYATEVGGNYNEHYWMTYTMPIECFKQVPNAAKLDMTLRRYLPPSTPDNLKTNATDTAVIDKVNFKGAGTLARSATHRANSRWNSSATFVQNTQNQTLTFTLKLAESDGFTTRESFMLGFQASKGGTLPRQELNFAPQNGSWDTVKTSHVQYTTTDGAPWDCQAAFDLADDNRTVTVTIPRSCLSYPTVYIQTSETYQVSNAVHLFPVK